MKLLKAFLIVSAVAAALVPVSAGATGCLEESQAFSKSSGPEKKTAFSESLAYEHVEILASGIVQATLKRSAAKAGKTLRQRIQVTTFDAACRNVAAGLGVAIVPREVAATYAQGLGLRLVPLSDGWAERRFVICMRSREGLS